VIRLAAIDGHGAEALTVAGASCLGVAYYGGNSGELEAADVLGDAEGDPFNDEVHCGVVQRMRRRVAQIHLIARGRQGCPQISGEAGVGTFAVVDDDLDFANVASGGGWC
jgi:hypothetical protein